jgi:hypothetical protein
MDEHREDMPSRVYWVKMEQGGTSNHDRLPTQ